MNLAELVVPVRTWEAVSGVLTHLPLSVTTASFSGTITACFHRAQPPTLPHQTHLFLFSVCMASFWRVPCRLISRKICWGATCFEFGDAFSPNPSSAHDASLVSKGRILSVEARLPFISEVYQQEIERFKTTNPVLIASVVVPLGLLDSKRS